MYLAKQLSCSKWRQYVCTYMYTYTPDSKTAAITTDYEPLGQPIPCSPVIITEYPFHLSKPTLAITITYNNIDYNYYNSNNNNNCKKFNLKIIN